MNSTQEVTIETLVAGGDGLGRASDGRVVFVPYTAPGDRVRVRIVAEQPRHLRATALELLEPGPGRSDPLCAVFGSCGGCAWQHLAYDAQLAAKQTILRDAFARIARLTVPERLVVVPSPSPYGYRARARVFVQRGRVGFRRRRSHSICATSRCPILVPDLDGALAALATDPPKGSHEWELAVGDAGDVRSAARGDAGSSTIRLERGEDRLRISPGVFFQANALLRDALAEHVVEAAGRGDRLLELCAGAGFFTIALARRFARVVAVESDPAAVADLAANLESSGLSTRVELRTEGWETALPEWLASGAPPDAVVLDPPRVGLGRDPVDALARLAAPRIVYVSCDPATLARDAGVLADRGYELSALTGFDLFPQTPHLEAVAVLERSASS